MSALCIIQVLKVLYQILIKRLFIDSILFITLYIYMFKVLTPYSFKTILEA